MNNRIMLYGICAVLFLGSIAQRSDAGWKQLAPTGKPVISLAVRLLGQVDTIIYVGTKGGGIYAYSTGTGVLSPFYSAYLDSFELFMRNINAIYLATPPYVMHYAATDSGLFYYLILDRDSSHWGRVNSSPSGKVCAITGTNQPLFAATPREIYRNDGLSWTALNADTVLPSTQKAVAFSSLAISRLDSGCVYAGSFWRGIRPISAWSGIVQSTNNGVSWVINNWGLDYPDVLSLCFFKQDFADLWGFFAGGTDHGVYYYLNKNGKNWEKLKPGVLDNDTIYSMEVTTYGNSEIPELFACTNTGAYLLTAYPNASFAQAAWNTLGFAKGAFCAKAAPQNGNYTTTWFVGATDGLYRYTRENVPILHNEKHPEGLKPAVVFSHGSIIVYRLRGSDYTTHVSLYNSRGNLLKQALFGNSGYLRLDSKELPAGIYYVSIKNNEDVYSTRITLIR